MADASVSGQGAVQAIAGSNLVIPPETQDKFGELIALVKDSESMNDEERQYWINILPIMTPEQIQNLHDILKNEKDQLAAIDAKYAQAGTTPSEEELRKREQTIQEKRQQRQTAEQTAQSQETGSAENILKQIEGA